MSLDLSALRTRAASFLRETDARARAVPDDDDADPDAGPDLKIIGVVVIAAIGLTLVESFGTRTKTKTLLVLFELLGLESESVYRDLFPGGNTSILRRYAYWTSWLAFTYFLVPIAYWLWVRPRGRLQGLGLSLQNATGHWRVYLALYAVFLVPLGLATLTPSFLSYYPMFKGMRHGWSWFLLWEAVYLPQFLFIELFFRGFLILPFARRLGLYAICVPVVPYVMIHFGKPLPEVFGAIVAALVLGTIALRTRTIWLGVALHMSVALSMDIVASLARGRFPTTW